MRAERFAYVPACAFVPLFSQGKIRTQKNRAHLRGFARLSEQRHQASNLGRLKLTTILI